MSLVGSGCCPEAYGILKYLSEHHNGSKIKILIKSFDINSLSWKYSRDIVLNNFIYTHFQSAIVKHQSYDYDFTNKKFDKSDLIANSDLIIYQNCFNEVSETNHNQIIKNIDFIASKC